MSRTLTLSAIALITAGIAAQSTTIPAGFDKKEGPRGVHALLRYTPARQQAFYTPKATGWTKAKIIKSLWLRPDNSWSKGPAIKCDIMVEVSSKGTIANYGNVSGTWSKNHGSDKKVFMKRKTYSIPAFTKSTTPPQKWMIELKGDAPYVNVNKQMVVDTRVYTAKYQSNAYWYVDASSMYASTGTRGKYTRYGTPCNPTTFWNYATGYEVNSSLRTYGYTRNAGDVVFAWLGSKKLNLKISTGCSLYTNFVLLHPAAVKTPTGGYANFTWGTVPASAKGKVIYNQMAAITPKGQFRWSRGLEITIGNYQTTYDIFGAYSYSSSTKAFNPDKDGVTWKSSSAIIYDVK